MVHLKGQELSKLVSRGENIGHGSKGPKGLAFRTLGARSPLFICGKKVSPVPRVQQRPVIPGPRDLTAWTVWLGGRRAVQTELWPAAACSVLSRVPSHARCSSVACDKLCGHLAWLHADLSRKQLAATTSARTQSVWAAVVHLEPKKGPRNSTNWGSTETDGSRARRTCSQGRLGLRVKDDLWPATRKFGGSSVFGKNLPLWLSTSRKLVLIVPCLLLEV